MRFQLPFARVMALPKLHPSVRRKTVSSLRPARGRFGRRAQTPSRAAIGRRSRLALDGGEHDGSLAPEGKTGIRSRRAADCRRRDLARRSRHCRACADGGDPRAGRERSVQRFRDGGGAALWRSCGLDSSGHARREPRRSPCDFAQGRDGRDAAHAGHLGGPARSLWPRTRSLRSAGQHSGGRRVLTRDA